MVFVQAPDIYREEARRDNGSRTEQNTWERRPGGGSAGPRKTREKRKITLQYLGRSSGTRCTLWSFTTKRHHRCFCWTKRGRVRGGGGGQSIACPKKSNKANWTCCFRHFLRQVELFSSVLCCDSRVRTLCWPLWAWGSSAAAAGSWWIRGGLLVAVVRRYHFIGSPMHLQGRDGADVPGEFGFPPHQRALSTLIFLDLYCLLLYFFLEQVDIV